MDNDKATMVTDTPHASLPRSAFLPINRCNLPANILGSITFQRHPAPLYIDGVSTLHHDLFRRLDGIKDAGNRAQQFIDYMTVHFRLHAPDEAGLTADTRVNRSKADYLRLLRGWSFDAEGRDAAVLKGWVESRFGLMPRFHRTPIHSADDEAYQHYLHAYAEGLYNTNSLEAQFDLLYSYCQYEAQRSYPGVHHLTLYRGINNPEEYEQMGHKGRQRIMLLNSINSFSANSERAGEFGDYILEAKIPLAKLAFFHGLLPSGVLQGEEEYAVLGGLYELKMVDW